jgi:hypothetical protein
LLLDEGGVEFEILNRFYRGEYAATLAIGFAGEKDIAVGGEQIPLKAGCAGIGEANMNESRSIREHRML